MTEGHTNKVRINQTEDGTPTGNPNLSKYWTGTNPCFIETTSALAEIFFYYSGDHSAVVSTVSGMYESKWGQLPLVRHFPTQVPSIYQASMRKYYTRTPPISGPDVVGSCASTFTLNNLSTGLSVSWTVSPSLSIASSTANSVSVMKTNNADTDLYAWVSASFSSPGHSFSIQKPVIAWRTGIQSSSVSETIMQSSLGPYGGDVALYSPFGSSYATTLGSAFYWTTNADWEALVQGYCFTIFDGSLFCGATLEISVNFTDVCGGTSSVYRYFDIDCPAYSFVSAYPNPVSGTLTVDVDWEQYNLSKNLPTNTSSATPSSAGAVSRSSPAVDERLYSIMGTLVKQAASSGSSLQINVSDLQPGFYSLRVNDGHTGQLLSTQLIRLK